MRTIKNYLVLLCSLFMLPLFAEASPSPVVTFTWEISNDQKEITHIFANFITTTSFFTVDWGDGTSGTEDSHTYNTAGTYQVAIYENDPAIHPLTILALGINSAPHITQIDLSKATSLDKLFLYGGEFTQLDLSNNTALTLLNFDQTQFSSLDISHNAALKMLGCYSNHRLTTLDVSQNTALEELRCRGNSQLTTLKIGQNPSIDFLDCAANAIPLVELYRLAQSNIPRKMLAHQRLPSIVVPINTPVAMDTVFYGIDSEFVVTPSNSSYTTNNGEITFLAQGDYGVSVWNLPALGTGSVQQRIVVTTLTDGVFLDKSTLSLGIGSIAPLKATVLPLTASKNVSWSSSDPDVAIVYYDGTVLAKAVGTATITATTEVGGYVATCAVTVSSPYNVTVFGGIGNNRTIEGATVPIQAIQPLGKVFDVWTSSDGVVFDDAHAPSTTFVMPAKDVTVTANYTDIIYQLSLTDATSDKPAGAKYGEAVTVTANTPATGKVFDKWLGGDELFGDEEQRTVNPLRFDIERDISLTATISVAFKLAE